MPGTGTAGTFTETLFTETLERIIGFRLSRIVTRSGDDGTTGLADGSRVAKTDVRIAAIGAVDELNSHIGLLRAETCPPDVDADLSAIQHELFDLGGALSLPGQAVLPEVAVSRVEARLEHYNAGLPPLAEFILPGGCRAAALAHIARTVCRRAERDVVALSAGIDAERAPRLYLNRLSDLLFVLARVLNREAGVADVYWRGPKQR